MEVYQPCCRLGVKTRVFHLGDYRRATVGPGQEVPDDYFFVNGEPLFHIVIMIIDADGKGDQLQHLASHQKDATASSKSSSSCWI